jgi:hypothetical protein
MKMKKLMFTFLVLFLGTAFSYAADVDGKWKASFSGGGGPDGGAQTMELVFNFKADGEKLTGSITSPMGDMPITNGKIVGKELSFDIDVNGMAIKHKGTIDGDVIKLKMEGMGGPDGGQGAPDGANGMELKRVK